MMIEKRNFHGGMNGDLSARLLPDTDCLNLMNGRTAVTKYGRLGRYENCPGTTKVSQQVLPPYGQDQTIGTAVDLENMRLIFFNYNTFSDHGIYCYDPFVNFIYAVAYDSKTAGGLGFSKNSLIHSARVENGCLYWADSTNNEPRRLNINAGINMNHPGTFPNVVAYKPNMAQSVIRWIRRQPGLPLTSVKATDANFNNNFIKNEAFQFDWRYICRDYETTTLSGLSLLQNYNLATDNSNFITITAPLGETIEQDIIQVDFVAKYLNGGKSFIIHSWNVNIPADLAAINAHNAGTTALSFNFYNDTLGIALDDAYSAKPYDSLPIYAQTIEMARFRSFLANYTIGYNTPTLTSLIAAAQQSSTAVLTGQWILIQFNFGASVHYFLDLGVLGIFDTTVQPTPPPYPSTYAYANMTFVAAGPANFSLYVVSSGLYPNWINGIQYPGSSATITGGPPVPGIAGTSAYKSGANYQVSISFLDHSGRKCGILTNSNLKIPIGERAYNQINYTTNINWSLSNIAALAEIPIWAYYYSINISKCLTTRHFLQQKVRNITYAVKDPITGIWTYNTTAYSPTLNGIAFDSTRLISIGMGYVFSPGDLVKLYIGSNLYNLSIIGQDGNWVICELANVGTLGNTASPMMTALFEIYTPYKTSVSEPNYEVAQIYKVTNPATGSRQYSTLAGSIRGDITLLTRNDGNGDYLTENMSPNDKFYQNWNTDAGRPNFIDTIGQTVNTNKVCYSNTLIQGSKVNGLSTFDALDTKDINSECGSITKLQLANKVSQEQGDVMLAICVSDIASMYLGEVQLVGQTGNAFVAQAPSVIGTINVLKGSLGTTRPESVCEYLGLVFGIDLNVGEFWQYSVNGSESVSRYKMKRFFKNYCDVYNVSNANNLDNINGFHHIRSTINPFHKEVSVTLPALIYQNYANNLPGYTSVPSYTTSIVNRFDIWDELQKTMNFCFEENKWGSNFEWVSEWSDFLQETQYLFKNGNLYIADSNVTNWNTVFGVQYPMRICTTANLNPSNIKDLYNIAIEGDSTIPNYVVALTAVPNQQITDLASIDSQWQNNESVCDATFLGDRLDPNQSGTFDQKLFTGSVLKDFSIFVMAEWQVYDRLLYVQFINVGYDSSKGQTNITKVINP